MTRHVGRTAPLARTAELCSRRRVVLELVISAEPDGCDVARALLLRVALRALAGTDPCGKPLFPPPPTHRWHACDLTLEPFQHRLELSVLQPKFANKLAAQELYLVVEADGLRGNGGSVRKLGSGDCFRGPVPVSPWR